MMGGFPGSQNDTRRIRDAKQHPIIALRFKAPHEYPHSALRPPGTAIPPSNLYAKTGAIVSPALAAGSSGAQAPAALGLDQLAAHLYPERSLDLGLHPPERCRPR